MQDRYTLVTLSGREGTWGGWVFVGIIKEGWEGSMNGDTVL